MEDLNGRHLGQFEIRQLIGEGGMAAVYRAYQPSMGRSVAVKILSREVARDPQFVGRFKREARLIANLEHAHILPVYDFGEDDGYLYIAMRLVEAGTLADQLVGKPLPPERILHILRQVGDALDYAHGRGIIHRDIKPNNILIDQAGNCLLADFGIAKAEGAERATKFTQTGAIIGTPAYMSPEQGLGEPIDSRSDIYSLGVVLYQMATGQAPYNAATPMAVMIQHIQANLPPPRSYNPALSYEVEQVILKSMARAREERYPTARALTSDLGAAIGVFVPPPTPPPAELPPTVPAKAPTPPPAPPPAVSLPPTPIPAAPATVHPSGSFSVWTIMGIVGGSISLVLLGAVIVVGSFFLFNRTPTPVPTGAVGAASSTTPARTSAPATAVMAAAAATATLAPTATALPPQLIVFDSTRQDNDTEIYSIQPDGSHLNRLTYQAGIDDEADLSPDGRWVAYESNPGSGWTLMVVSVDGGTSRTLVPGREPDWSPDGSKLAYEKADSRGRLQIWLVDASGSGSTQLTNDDRDSRAPSWSPDGSRIVYMSNIAGAWQLVVVDVAAGRQTQITRDTLSKRFPVWSPDGSSIAYNTLAGNDVGQIWTVRADGNAPAELTTDGQNGRPAWSPDGQRLVFNSNRTGDWLLYIMNHDGSAQKQLTLGGSDQRPDWGAK